VPRSRHGASVESAGSTQTAFLLKEYAKMIEDIEHHQASIEDQQKSLEELGKIDCGGYVDRVEDEHITNTVIKNAPG